MTDAQIDNLNQIKQENEVQRHIDAERQRLQHEHAILNSMQVALDARRLRRRHAMFHAGDGPRDDSGRAVREPGDKRLSYAEAIQLQYARQ